MSSSKAASSPGVGGGRVLWIVGALSFGLVAVVLVGLFVGLATSNLPTPKAVATLHLVKDVSLPTAAIAPAGHAPIQSLPADGFDFQALDPRTGLLFITHAGPSANKQALIRNQLPAGTRFQSQLVVFDTKKQAVIGHIAIRNVHGVTVAPDLGRAYAADVTDHQVYVIDEHSLRVIATIQLGLLPCSFAPCETPDALEYDAVDHKLFISGNGTDNAHQDISVIDTRTNLFSGLIPLGQDQFGD